MTFETVLKITQMKDCPRNIAEGRIGHSIVVYKNSFYIFGGWKCHHGQYFNDLIRYDLKTQLWSQVITNGERPTPRYGHSAVIFRSSMFVFKGKCYDHMPNNDLYEYKFEDNKWTRFNFYSAPAPQRNDIVAVYDNRLWILTGYDLWTLTLWGGTKSWENVEQKGYIALQGLNNNCPMVVVRDQLYILQQFNGIRFQVFNFSKKEWSRLEDPPTNKCPYSMGIFHHQIIVFSHSIEVLCCYDLNSQTWLDISEDSESVVRPQMLEYRTIFFENALYACCGMLNGSFSTALYKVQLNRKYSECSVHEDYEKILETGLFTDMEFVVGENEIKIPAHLAILAARSEWFRAHIREKSISAKDLPVLQVKLPGALPEVFEMMLKYIYTDRIDPKQKSLLLYLHLYGLATEIRLNNLEELIVKQLSDQFLKKSITLANVLKVLSMANTIGLLVVKEFCLNFIIKDVNCSKVVESLEFEALDNSLQVQIIRRKIKPVSSQILSNVETLDSNHSNFAQDMKAFLGSVGQEFSDVTLVLGDCSIPAHKCILAARSSYFEALFRSFTPSDNIVNIKIGEIIPSKEAFDVFLQYIYYGNLNIPIEHSFILCFAADFYGFTNNCLQEAIKKNIKRNGTFDAIVKMLKEAYLAQQTDLKIFLLELVVQRCPSISSWPEKPKLPHMLWIEIVNELAKR